MATHAMQRDHESPTGTLPRSLVAGFIAGALSVLIFHQGALALLHVMNFTPATPFAMKATQPFGVPQVWSLAFWGGVWGVVLAAALARMEGARLVGAAIVFGAVVLTLVAWFVAAPLKGQPIAAGWHPAAMAVGPIVNAAWGLGTGLGLWLFGRRRATTNR